MSDIKESGTIFIRENTPLPKSVSIDSGAFLPGWRVVRNPDRTALAGNIEAAKWYFFYLAGELRATVLGRNRPRAVRRAVQSILARRGEEKFNSLEIVEITSKWFFGIPLLSVTAHARHIQERVGLIQ